MEIRGPLHIEMPRQLRIEYPGAFYHAYSRGNQKQPIFISDEDRFYFLKIVRQANERFGVVIHIYCLMGNHYHLTLETPEGNLSQIMHFVNTAYTVYLNKKRRRCGHLFQGRFKVILVQTDVYARALATYIHGNPVRDKIVERPEDYPWSSCRDYYGKRIPPAWLETSVVRGVFGNSLEILRLEHERYLDPAAGAAFKKDLERASKLGILGDDDFVDRIRRARLKDRMEDRGQEICELRRLRVRPELAEIKDQVEKEFGTKSRLARKCVIFLAHKYADYKLREIGTFFMISSAAVSVSFRKTANEIASNGTLVHVVEAVRSRLSPAGAKK